MSKVKLSAKQILKITRACKALDDVLEEVQKANPDCYINWYLEDCGNMNLLEGDSHDGSEGKARQDRVIERFDIRESSGGGW